MEKNQVVRIHLDEGVRTGLVVQVTPKYVRVIWPDSAGMKIRKLPNDRYLRYQVIEDYSLRACKKAMRLMCRRFGSTKTARAALRG